MFLFSWLNSLRHHKTTAFFYCEFFGKKLGRKLSLCFKDQIITIAIPARFFMVWFDRHGGNQSQSPCDKDKGGTKLSLEKKIQRKIHFLPQNRKIVLVFRWSNSWIQSKREFFVAIFVKIFANFPITTRKKLPFLVFAKCCFDHVMINWKIEQVLRLFYELCWFKKNKKTSRKKVVGPLMAHEMESVVYWKGCTDAYQFVIDRSLRKADVTRVLVALAGEGPFVVQPGTLIINRSSASGCAQPRSTFLFPAWSRTPNSSGVAPVHR